MDILDDDEYESEEDLELVLDFPYTEPKDTKAQLGEIPTATITITNEDDGKWKFKFLFLNV